ncbi:hypothetical protein BIFGAL_02586 [Bifidobacterium gallicum DSM 20093 = LMG 11596]|uniref:Uncharacterized protein n=1 Tax=Bifidobacterium gallicum DSM 20093 = LMG 11596 TaxID=561180 RepID=D1NS32_9BIFI|nr:hypothetical protein BIFGAL_02586 [Bifidobacterium gallicum DSM 20093 = LMG 11596]
MMYRCSAIGRTMMVVIVVVIVVLRPVCTMMLAFGQQCGQTAAMAVSTMGIGLHVGRVFAAGGVGVCGWLIGVGPDGIRPVDIGLGGACHEKEP